MYVHPPEHRVAIARDAVTAAQAALRVSDSGLKQAQAAALAASAIDKARTNF